MPIFYQKKRKKKLLTVNIRHYTIIRPSNIELNIKKRRKVKMDDEILILLALILLVFCFAFGTGINNELF